MGIKLKASYKYIIALTLSSDHKKHETTYLGTL